MPCSAARPLSVRNFLTSRPKLSSIGVPPRTLARVLPAQHLEPRPRVTHATPVHAHRDLRRERPAPSTPSTDTASAPQSAPSSAMTSRTARPARHPQQPPWLMLRRPRQPAKPNNSSRVAASRIPPRHAATSLAIVTPQPATKLAASSHSFSSTRTPHPANNDNRC